MSIVCTVEFDIGIEAIEIVEREHPHLMEAVMRAATGRMTSHRRLVAQGRVLDIDEYPSEAVYREFLALAGPSIEEYGRRCGAMPKDTLYAEYAPGR